MSKFEGLRTRPKEKKSSKFEGLRLKPKTIEVIEEDLSPSYLDRAKQFGSGVLAGVSRLGMQEGADQFGAGVMEVAPGVVVPIQPESAIAGAESAEKGLEALESIKPEKDDSIGNVLYKAGEFGGAAASMPIPGAGTAANITAKAVSTMPKETAKAILYLASKYGVNPTVNTIKRVYNTPFGEGATIGAGSGLLQEGGVDPLVADLTSMALTPTIMRAPNRAYNYARHPLKNVAYPTARKIFGINEKNFNLKAAEAADRLGLDLNLAELNPNNNVAWANNIAAKNLLSSKAVELHNKGIDDRIKDIIEENLNTVGPKKTDEVEKLIDTKYAKTRKLFPKNPEDRMILPEHSVKSLQEGFNTTSLSPSPSETAVLTYKQKILDQLAPGAFIDGKKIEGYTPPIQPIDAQILYDTKVSLNSKDPNNIIRYNNPETTVRNNVKKFGRGYRKDLETLGERYPDWHASLKDADNFFANVAARENFENALINGGFNYDKFNYQPGMMSRNLNYPKKLKKIQHTYKNKPKATKEKLNQNLVDLGEVSDAIVKRNKSNPNPSGTAYTAKAISDIFSLGNAAYSLFTLNPMLGSASLVSPIAKFLGPRFTYNNVVNNKKLIADTIENMKNSKPKIPFKNKLLNSRANYIYPTINNIRNRDNN